MSTGRKAMICECVSNSVFLVKNALALDLKPVAVYSPISKGEDTFAEQFRSATEKVIKDMAEIVRSMDMDDLVLRLLGMDIVCVMVGFEYSIPYCDELSMRLGFSHNSSVTTLNCTGKLCMRCTLERAGMHCIRSILVSFEDNIRLFLHNRVTVVKLSVSVRTISVHVCRTLDECLAAYREVTNTLGRPRVTLRR